MKVYPFKIPKAQNIGLIYQEDRAIVFYDKLHQHDEIQISYIVRGEGTILVGDSVKDYSCGDIIVVGANHPHLFKSDKKCTEESYMISLFFTKESFGELFFELDDFKSLNTFFRWASSSFRVCNPSSKLYSYFSNLSDKNQFGKFVIFMQILECIMALEKEKLSSMPYVNKISDREGKRMRKIIDYTLNNFHRPTNLSTISSIANLTTNSFCRYFKQRTNKTYTVFLNEIRVEYACKLLRTSDTLVADISERCGFNNISNFNRKFKELKGIPPSQYRISQHN